MNNNLMDFFKKDRFAAYNGIKLVKAEPGFAVTEMEVTENHMNAANTVQGGAIYTLADFAFAAASNSYGFITLGINSSISYFKSPKGKFLTAKASEVSTHKNLCCYNVDVFDGNMDLIARFTATGYIKKDKLEF